MSSNPPWTADSGTTADSSITVDNPPGSGPPPGPLEFTADSITLADSSVTVDNPQFNAAQYPNVPAMPGVPVLARLQTAAVVAAQASGAGLNAALAAQLGLPAGTVFGSSQLYAGLNLEPLDPSYSIVDSDGNIVITPDSAVEVDVNVDSSINTHPIELGQFEGYNRVQKPARVRLLLACQGKNMEYTEFLSTLKDLREGTTVVTLFLPNDYYDNMALKGFGYSRKAERGAITIYADTQWEEERSTNVVVSAPKTTAPQGAPPVNLGAVSAATPTPKDLAAIMFPPVKPLPLPVNLPQFTAQGIVSGINNPLGNGGSPPSLDAY